MALFDVGRVVVTTVTTARTRSRRYIFDDNGVVITTRRCSRRINYFSYSFTRRSAILLMYTKPIIFTAHAAMEESEEVEITSNLLSKYSYVCTTLIKCRDIH